MQLKLIYISFTGTHTLLWITIKNVCQFFVLCTFTAPIILRCHVFHNNGTHEYVYTSITMLKTSLSTPTKPLINIYIVVILLVKTERTLFILFYVQLYDDQLLFMSIKSRCKLEQCQLDFYDMNPHYSLFFVHEQA